MGSAIFTATVSVACLAPGPIPTGTGVTVTFSCELSPLEELGSFFGTGVTGELVHGVPYRLNMDFWKDDVKIMELAQNSISPTDIRVVPGQEDVLTQSQISATLLNANTLEVTITDFPQSAVGEWYCESTDTEAVPFYYLPDDSTNLETFCGDVEPVVQNTEPVIETTEPANARDLLDVVYVIDWSKSSISKEEIMDFSKQVAEKLDLEGDVRAGAVYFKGKAAGQLLGLDATGVTSSTFGDAIDLLPAKKKGQTRTHLGLDEAKTMFEKNSRIEACQVAVVITDGASDTQTETYQSAEDLQALGVRMCVVQFGSGTPTEESNRDALIQTLVGAEGQKLRNEAAPDNILPLVNDTLACIRACPIPVTTCTTHGNDLINRKYLDVAPFYTMVEDKHSFESPTLIDAVKLYVGALRPFRLGLFVRASAKACHYTVKAQTQWITPSATGVVEIDLGSDTLRAAVGDHLGFSWKAFGVYPFTVSNDVPLCGNKVLLNTGDTVTLPWKWGRVYSMSVEVCVGTVGNSTNGP